MSLSMVPVGDAQLCVDTIGREGDPAVLLIGGATSSMDWWEPEFCERIAAAGRFVIRYDHRDTGQSTASPVGAPAYTGDDLSADPLRILDALGVRSAHLVGVSMGGGIAQDIAVQHPERVLSLTLIATTAAFERADPTPLPPPEPASPPASSDEQDARLERPDAVVERMVEVHRLYAGSLGLDEERVRAISRIVVERTPDVRGERHQPLDRGRRRRGRPAHDGRDRRPHAGPARHRRPVLPAAARPGARRRDPRRPAGALEGMGHEVPPRALWDVVVPAIVDAQPRRASGHAARGSPPHGAAPAVQQVAIVPRPQCMTSPHGPAWRRGTSSQVATAARASAGSARRRTPAALRAGPPPAGRAPTRRPLRPRAASAQHPARGLRAVEPHARGTLGRHQRAHVHQHQAGRHERGPAGTAGRGRWTTRRPTRRAAPPRPSTPAAPRPAPPARRAAPGTSPPAAFRRPGRR